MERKLPDIAEATWTSPRGVAVSGLSGVSMYSRGVPLTAFRDAISEPVTFKMSHKLCYGWILMYFCLTHFFSISMWHEGGLRFRFSTCLARTIRLIGTGSILRPLAAATPQACGRLVQLSFAGMFVKLLSLKLCGVLRSSTIWEQWPPSLERKQIKTIISTIA